MMPAEEKTPSSSFLGLGSKSLRGARVCEILGFMPAALLNLINAYDESSDKETQQLLIHVAQGEQEQAEAMLKINPDLLFEKGTVTDLSQRTFKDVTAFQYALWELDWHMWTMLLKYMSQEEAAEQWKELERVGTAHGKHASWQGLIDGYTGYMRLATAASAAKWTGTPYEAAKAYWIERIGGMQILLPAHVVNEYCHENRAFYPLPDFGKGEELTRSRLSGRGDWYDLRSGKERGHVRGSYGKAFRRDGGDCGGYAGYDKGAVVLLLETRQRQLAELAKTLSVDLQPVSLGGRFKAFMVKRVR